MPVAEMTPSLRVRRVGTVDSIPSPTNNEVSPSKNSPKMSLESLFASRASLLDLKQLAPELPQSLPLLLDIAKLLRFLYSFCQLV